MSIIPIEEKVYDDGRTKQSFKDSCDVNSIIRRAQRAGALSHLDRFGGQYGDFENFDFFEAQLKIKQAQEIFSALPRELKKEFNNDPSQFFAAANAAPDSAEFGALLQTLSAPGRQLPSAQPNRPDNPGAPGHGGPPDEPGPPQDPTPPE